jgi:hypothetical protein
MGGIDIGLDGNGWEDGDVGGMLREMEMGTGEADGDGDTSDSFIDGTIFKKLQVSQWCNPKEKKAPPQ